MPQSARPRASQIRELLKLAGECRELGDDTYLWRQHWFAGMARVADADLAMGGEKTWPIDGHESEHLGDTGWGWEHGFDPVGWQYAIQQFINDPDYSPSEMRYIARAIQDNGLALSRTDVMEDREWYGSSDFLGIQQVIGIDHTLWCYHSVPGTRGLELNGVVIGRAEGRRDFNSRDKALIRLGHDLVVSSIGRELARFTEPAPSALTARTRKVLRCLLEGDSNKQIAVRLGIGRHGVNQYARVIFRHFRVSSRAELLARWVRRRWNETALDVDVQALSARTRDVLRLILEGENDRAIGLRLGITRNTVNHYAKVIFAHFGVSSRSELLARWLPRNPGLRFAWDADE